MALETIESGGKLMNLRIIGIAAAVLLVLAACSSDTVESTAVGDDSATQTSSPAAAGGEEAQPPSTPGSGGSATLTIGDQTYEFDEYYCIQGSANTGNSRASFSSGAFGDIDGVRVQLDASIQDMNEGDAMEGEGTIHSVSLNDIEDFQNPSVSWDAVTGFISAPAWTVEYDGSTVRADALFDDGLTDDLEEIPGTLEATCS